MQTAPATKSTMPRFDRANFLLQSTFFFFNIIITISYLFSPPISKNLHAALVKKCAPAEVAHCFTATMAASLLGKLPVQSVFDWPKQMAVRRCQIWTVQPRLAKSSMIFKLVWTWLYCVVVFSGLAVEVGAFSLVNVMM